MTNAARAELVRPLVMQFRDDCGMKGEDEETVVSDLLADLLHYARHNNCDPAAVIRRGLGHYTEEHNHPEDL